MLVNLFMAMWDHIFSKQCAWFLIFCFLFVQNFRSFGSLFYLCILHAIAWPTALTAAKVDPQLSSLIWCWDLREVVSWVQFKVQRTVVSWDITDITPITIWSPMITYDYLWLPMIIYDYLWLPMMIYDDLWLSMNTYDDILTKIAGAALPSRNFCPGSNRRPRPEERSVRSPVMSGGFFVFQICGVQHPESMEHPWKSQS